MTEKKKTVKRKTVKKNKVAYKDLEKLKKVFSSMKDKSKSKLGLSLIDEALFCGETLTKLKEAIKKSGVVTEMDQGKYSIERENPALRSYNTTIKNYQNIIKQLNDMLNKEPAEEDLDELEEFLK